MMAQGSGEAAHSGERTPPGTSITLRGLNHCGTLSGCCGGLTSSTRVHGCAATWAALGKAFGVVVFLRLAGSTPKPVASAAPPRYNKRIVLRPLRRENYALPERIVGRTAAGRRSGPGSGRR